MYDFSTWLCHYGFDGVMAVMAIDFMRHLKISRGMTHVCDRLMNNVPALDSVRCLCSSTSINCRHHVREWRAAFVWFSLNDEHISRGEVHHPELRALCNYRYLRLWRFQRDGCHPTCRVLGSTGDHHRDSFLWSQSGRTDKSWIMPNHLELIKWFWWFSQCL